MWKRRVRRGNKWKGREREGIWRGREGESKKRSEREKIIRVTD